MATTATLNLVTASATPEATKVTPYFDDYSEDKNFHRVLFKPGVAVQSRELTQSQTILQNQIKNVTMDFYGCNQNYTTEPRRSRPERAQSQLITISIIFLLKRRQKCMHFYLLGFSSSVLT